MSLRTQLLPAVEAARKLTGPSFADVRVNQLTIRKRTWSGSRIALGDPTDEDLVLPPHYPIRYMTAQEIFSAGGLYETGDVLVDHITPSDGAGTGYTLEQLRPVVEANNVDVIYILTGTHAGEYRCIDVRTYRAFTSQLVLRRRATTP
jgi:hypothetical protein